MRVFRFKPLPPVSSKRGDPLVDGCDRCMRSDSQHAQEPSGIQNEG